MRPNILPGEELVPMLRVIKRPGNAGLVGEEGLEPSRLAARDPKSRSSANSDIPPHLLLATIAASRF
jgi:hypothetical protein